MDTILYFYPVKNFSPGSLLKVSEHQFPVYRLIKIGLTPDMIVLLEEDFQGWQTWKKENSRKSSEEKVRGRKSRTNKEVKTGKAAVGGSGRKKQPQTDADSRSKQGSIRFLAGFGKGRQKKKWEAEKKTLLDSVFQLWGEPCSSYCVCSRPITYFNKWEFTDYRESKWVEYLLHYGTLAHFVVLGNVPCLQEILPPYARKMKSLRFFMKESEVTEELEALLEYLLTEYGIAADICCLDEDIAYRKLPSLSALPCNILDFSGEEKISHWVAAPGSIWIDFDGNEEKQRRFESRERSVHYISLRKEWSRA